ncbi:MAG: hypothetical protein JF615_12065, partial [Asticcacaulis sp.]|nr:hypothetical protein [Asticcacaulis sp.]
AQRRAVKADGHAALAVTLGGGDWSDLHPVNKRLVGARLAMAARSLIYHDAVAPSGPEVASVRLDGATVRVELSGVDGALVAYSGFPTGFALCDAVNTCHYVQAHVDGNAVVLTDPAAASAAKVRYGWANSPVLNLYDASGRPAGPFEMAVAK